MPNIDESTLKWSHKVTTDASVGMKHKIKFEYDVIDENDKNQYSSEIEFYINDMKKPTEVTLSFIKAEPQRLGLGKLMVNVFAQVVDAMGLDNTSLCMNTPEEHDFYTSVGFIPSQDEIDNYTKILTDSNFSEEEIKQHLAIQSMQMNKNGTVKNLISCTKKSVEQKFSPTTLETINTIVTHVSDPIVKKNNEIKDVVELYKNHLVSKIKDYGYTIGSDGSISSEPKNEKDRYLIQRYNLMKGLHDDIKEKKYLDKSDIKATKEAFHECCKNHPTLDDKPFLEKLATILKFGVTAVFKALVSSQEKSIIRAGLHVEEEEKPRAKL